MDAELAANEPRQRKARPWNVQTGTLHRQVFVPIRMRLLKSPPVADSGPDRYQLALGAQVGRVFEICPEWSNDKLQGFFNQEADEVAMDAEIAIGG